MADEDVQQIVEENPNALVTNQVLDLKLQAAAAREGREHWKTRAIVAATVIATNTPLVAGVATLHYWSWWPW